MDNKNDMPDALDALAGVESPDWVGGLLALAVLFFAYCLVG